MAEENKLREMRVQHALNTLDAVITHSFVRCREEIAGGPVVRDEEFEAFGTATRKNLDDVSYWLGTIEDEA